MGNLVFQATLGGQVNLVGPNTASTFNLNVPATSSTIATLTGTETFTNKTLTTPVISSLSSASATALTLQSAGTTAITVDTSQRVGIGTTTPTNILEIVNASNPTIRITDTTNNCYTELNATDTVGYVGTASNHAFGFTTNNTERMRIDTSGNVGIGTTSPTQKLQVAGNAFISAGQYFMWDNAGAWSWQSDASSYLRAYTNGNERMRIDSSGKFFVGATADIAGAGAAQGAFLSTTSGRFGLAIGNTGGTAAYGLGINSSTGDNVYFYYQGTYKGAIATGSGGTTYGTSSDYRLKENIAPMTGALAKVAQLKPVTYKWKTDGSDGQGFIAHELAEVCSQAVTGEKDEVDEDGNPKYQGIDTSFLVATLTAAIQELKAINDTQAETINALTARIVALEAK